LNSCLYECRILHHRLAPKPHRFTYRLFYFAIDLDELEQLHAKLRLFSFNRANLYSFRGGDFFPTHEPLHNPSGADGSRPSPEAHNLKARVLDWIAERGLDPTGVRVVLVTLPRVAGYLFNPVSFYFCFDRHGAPLTTIAEVTNTFRELKHFHVHERRGERTFHVRMPKHFYVSPFSDVDVEFDFTLRVPASHLAIQIDDYIQGQRTLISTLTGVRTELTDRRLAWFTLKYPFLTLRVIALIHWHALRLRTKRLPWFAKTARGEAQRELHRPHSSLVSAPS
jgi:uncharacterized protein